MTLALLLASCSQKVNLSPVTSWAATLAYMSELWIENRVPTSLVQDSISAARKEVDKVRKKASNADVEKFDASLSALEKGIENGDKAAVAREISRCRHIHEALE